MAAELALLLCDQRRWDEAESYLAYGGKVDGEMPVQGKVYSIYRFAAKGRLAAQRGAFGEALDLARRAVEVAERGPLNYRARVWLALAEVQRASGQTADADDVRRDGARALRAEGQRCRRRPPALDRCDGRRVVSIGTSQISRGAV